MGRVDNELRDKVLFARLHPKPPRSPATLLAIGRDRRALEIPGIRNRNRNLFIRNEILKLKLSGLIDDRGAAGIAILVANLRELLDNHLAELRRRRQDGLDIP